MTYGSVTFWYGMDMDAAPYLLSDFKGFVAVCHSFCIYFSLYFSYIHTSFIHKHSLRPVSISSQLSAQWVGPQWLLGCKKFTFFICVRLKWLLYDFLSLKNGVNVPSKRNKQKKPFLLATWRSLTKRAKSGSGTEIRGSTKTSRIRNIAFPYLFQIWPDQCRSLLDLTW